jgi:preprotein translocase subunit SecG
MYVITVVFHVLACMALILIVLLQTGKGAEMGAAFGGASQTLFGGSGGTTFLSKLTTGAAVAFMITCLGLTYLSAGPRTKSIMEDVPIEKSEAPLLPDAQPIQPGAQPPVAPAAMPKPEASAAPVLPPPSPTTAAQEAPKAQSPATQAQEPPKTQEPAKTEKKAAVPPKAEDKRQDKSPAGPAGGKKQ